MRRCALGWTLLALSLFPALVSAGEDTLPPPGLAPATVENNLVFRRQNGSVIRFPPEARSWIWCGPWRKGTADVPSLHILTSDTTSPPYWSLDAVLADVTIGEPLLFPNSFIYTDPDSVLIFVWDPPNELSTQEHTSAGFIVFQALGCGASEQVQFSIDATIGSEFGDGTPITVQGDFRATISGPPVPTRPLTWGKLKATYR
jgi:hypothetical protein